MISPENIIEVKKRLYENYRKTNRLRILGGLFKLRKIINSVLCDTSLRKFRVYEASKHLFNNGYIRHTSKSIYITEKLVNEVEKQIELDQFSKLKQWY